MYIVPGVIQHPQKPRRWHAEAICAIFETEPFVFIRKITQIKDSAPACKWCGNYTAGYPAKRPRKG